MAFRKKQEKAVGVFLFLLSALLVAIQAGPVSAAPNSTNGPDRYTYIPVDYTTYTWWMMTWADSELVCKIDIDYEGLPVYTDVYVDCGRGLADAWLEQEVCSSEIYSNNPSDCPGFYMYLAESNPAQKDVAIALPPPVIWVSLQGCTVENGTNRCALPPTLVLQGEEPLAGEEIVAIVGTMNGEQFSCQGARCELYLAETGASGTQINFWAISSYGDTSILFDAYFRVVYAEDEYGMVGWYVDVLSSQWRGGATASCAESWQAFPPVGGLPSWLSSPTDVSELESDLQYEYLAGNLIKKGVVDASQCLDYGLDDNGQATSCGLEVAQPAMVDWQNRFDQLIMDASQDTQISAVLLKRLFARESQFWPGVFNDGTDVGLGQLTFEGADFAFLWNPVFFEQFCPLALDERACDQGYLGLAEEERTYLRELLVYSVNATCDTCPLGVDLAQADFSVNVFANTLRASCEQTGSVVYNNTGLSPGAAASYEDLWKFSLVNYNAGAGCLGLAIDATLDLNQALTWENLSENFTDVCVGTKDYVNDISRVE